MLLSEELHFYSRNISERNQTVLKVKVLLHFSPKLVKWLWDKISDAEMDQASKTIRKLCRVGDTDKASPCHRHISPCSARAAIVVTVWTDVSTCGSWGCSTYLLPLPFLYVTHCGNVCFQADQHLGLTLMPVLGRAVGCGVLFLSCIFLDNCE